MNPNALFSLEGVLARLVATVERTERHAEGVGARAGFN